MIGQGISRKNRHSERGVHPGVGKNQAVYSKMQPATPPPFHNQKRVVVFPHFGEKHVHFVSTGFSTDFVKKKAQFPTRFSTFSRSFPHGTRFCLYIAVMQPGDFLPVSGKKSGHFALLYKRKSKDFLFSFTVAALFPADGFGPSHDVEKKRSLEFSTERGTPLFRVGQKARENCGFPPSAAVLQQRARLPLPYFAPECVTGNRADCCVPFTLLCPVQKLPPSRFTPCRREFSLFLHALLRNTPAVRSGKYRIQTAGIHRCVVMKGVAMMAGSRPSFLAARGQHAGPPALPE